MIKLSDQRSEASLNGKLSRNKTALKRCKTTERRWNKKQVSRSSLEIAVILRPSSHRNCIADSLMGLKTRYVIHCDSEESHVRLSRWQVKALSKPLAGLEKEK